MRLKIISDGTTSGTRVINAETNEVLDGVASFLLTFNPVDGPFVAVTLNMVDVEFFLEEQDTGNDTIH